MYNFIIKDFGNGQRQAIYYSHPVSEQKRKLTVINEEIKKFLEMKKHPPNEELAQLATKRLQDLFYELDQLKAEKTLPCELTDAQYEKWLERKENEKINNRLKSDKRDKKKIFDYSRSNTWEWFATFTFSPETCDRTDYNACKKKLSKWLDNFNQRHCDGKLKYLALPEQHKRLEENGLHAWHFHALMTNVNESFLIPDEGKFDDAGRQIYRLFDNCKLGRTEFTRVDNTDAVAKYITKYITKSLGVNLSGKQRHLCSKNLNLPSVEKLVITSPDDISQYIDKNNVVWEQQKKYSIMGDERTMDIMEIVENEVI